MTAKLKLGLVGADATGKGWGSAAHVPALRGIERIELAALCTSRPESAAAAAEAYGIRDTMTLTNWLHSLISTSFLPLSGFPTTMRL